MANSVSIAKFPFPTIPSEGKAALDKLLRDTENEGKVPPVFFAACNAQEIIYENQEGWVEDGKPERGRINEDTTLHLFSMSKLVTSVACLQLVEQGKLAIDDVEAVAKHLPELAIDSLQILDGYDDDTG